MDFVQLTCVHTTNHISIVDVSVASDAEQEEEEEEEDMYENEDMNEDGNENENTNEGEESSLKMQKKVILRKS